MDLDKPQWKQYQRKLSAWSALILLGVLALAAISLGMKLGMAPPLLEGFTGGRGFHPASAGILAVLFAWITVVPAWSVLQMLRRPQLALALPVWAGTIGWATWLLLALVGPGGLGRPSSAAGGDWEWVTAHIALHGEVSLVLILAGAVVGAMFLYYWPAASKIGPLMLLLGVPWILLCRLLLADWAGGSDVLRNEPLPGDVFLLLLAAMLAVNGAVLGHSWRRPTIHRSLWTAVATAAILPVGWLLLELGLSPHVWNDPARASAIQLLLGSGQTSLSQWDLFFRWCVVQLTAVVALGCGQRIALGLTGGAWPRDMPEAAAQPAEMQPPEVTGRVPAHPGRAYSVLLLSFLAFTIYGSLVPLDFHFKPFGQALEQFLKTPYLKLGIGRRADWVANILLFMPLTFFGMGAFTRENTHRGRWTIALCVLPASFLLAVAIEFAQVYFPPRTVSLNDILAGCIGGLVGLGVWLLLGGPITRWARSLWADRDQRRLAVRILAGYLVVMVLYQFMPYDLIVNERELLVKVQQGKIHLLPFSDLRHLGILETVGKLALMVPVGYLFAVLAGERRHRLVIVAVSGLLLAVAMEGIQIFIYSRYSSSTDVILGCLGAAVGGWVAGRFGPAAIHPAAESRLLRVLGPCAAGAGAMVMAGALAWLKWWPFDFHSPPEGALRHAWAVLRVPFFHQYWNSELGALTHELRSFGAVSILALLLAGALSPLGRWGRFLATVLSIAAAAALEIGKLFVLERTPDATTAAIAMVGGILGVRLYAPLVNIFIKRPERRG